jgi:hypothetical protein
MSLNRLSAVAAVASAALAGAASADLVGGWTMPCRFPVSPNTIPTGTSYKVPLAVASDGSFIADPNAGALWDPSLAGRADSGARKLASNWELSSTHQLASSGTTPTSYTSPAGNGSAYAFSSNVWKAGDYYQAKFDTVGYSDVSFSWDMTRSSTGPATWIIEMSVNGGAFTALNSSFALSSSITFSASTYNALATNTLSLGASANNAAEVTVRIRALVDSVNSSNVFQAGGTARIDNVLINGTLVPAPGAAALVGLAGLIARRRRG